MKRYSALLMLTVCLFACSPKEDTAEAPDQPNILFLFTDDHTYTALSAMGNTEVKTPNFDRLAEMGTTFTHAYNMGAWNGAVCQASRAMFNSGRSVWAANAFQGGWQKRDSTAIQQSWAKQLEKAGYFTAMTGKWHVNIPPQELFNAVRDVRGGMPHDEWEHALMVQKFDSLRAVNGDPASIMPRGYNRPLTKEDNSWSPADTSRGGFWENGRHLSEVTRENGLALYHEARQQDKPFFLYLAFNAPHDPRQAPQKYLDMYPPESLSLPESWQPLYPDQDAIGLGPRLRDEALAPFPRTPYALRKHKQEYYALITHLDDQVGIILDELEANGDLENTMIFFTADHGLAMGRHGLLGKQNLYDHSMRAPLMVCGPGIPAGKKVEADVYIQDIMPSTLEVAGVDTPEEVDFHSLLSLATGKRKESHYSSIYGAYVNYQRMIRKDGFKLIVYPPLEKVLLFDLNADAEEMNDLSGKPEYQEKEKKLFEELLALQKEMQDPLDLTALFSNRYGHLQQ